MAVVFSPEKHTYTSLDLFSKVEWRSFSRISGMFKKEFDANKQALKSSQKKGSKWYGIPPHKILEIWDSENKRSVALGNWYHEREEKALLELDSAVYDGKTLPIIKPIWKDGVKYAPEQRLEEGIYPEHLCYSVTSAVCGQMDKIIVHDGLVEVIDHKTNKDVKKPAYVNWEGITDKMTPPLLLLDAHKLNEYAIQLSLGMYVILRHNPKLKPGKLTINYITFEIDGEDEYGYPIMTKTGDDYVIKGVEKIEVPYLKREVEIILNFLNPK